MVHTVTFNQAMLAKDRVFAIRAGAYTSSDIKEASFNYGYISGDTFKPGGTVAGSAKLTFTSIITSLNKLDKVYPEIGLKVGDSFEWVAMGEYFVNDINIDRNRNTTELDLMDGMFKLNQPYISDLTYPAQIRDVIREICVKTGVELETDDLGFRAIQHHIQSKADKKDITFREVLSQAIQLLGFSAFFNRKGKLEIRGLIESNITITADNYFLHGLTKSELMYQIAGITCKKDKETLTVGLRTGRSLELENNFMIQNILDDLYYDLKNIRYYPYSLDWQGHLKLDVGQWVTLKTNKNETFKVPVLTQSFNFKGGLKSKISADSKAGNDTQYAYKGFLGKRIEQMSTEIEAEVQQQLEYKDKEFDEKINKVKSEINDGIEQSRAEAERHAEQIKTEISQEFDTFEHEYQATKQSQSQQIADILAKAQANTILATDAKNIGNQAKADAAGALSRANQAKTEAIAEATRLDTVERQATETKLATAKSQAISEATRLVETAKSLLSGQISNISTDLSQTKEAIKLLATKKTVDTLTGRVSSAEAVIQVQADQISQRVKTSDFDQAKQRISTAESSITQLGNRITTEISETVAKIPTELGIRNLIKGTKDLSGNNPNQNTSDTYLGFNIARSRPSSGYIDTFRAATTINATATAYVTTFYARSDVDGFLIDCHLFSPNTTTSAESSTGHKTKAIDGLVNVRLTTEWTRYWVKWTQTPVNEIKTLIVGRNRVDRGNATVEIAGVALYEGDMPKDWSPAPEDAVAEIENVKTTITQTAEGQQQLTTRLIETQSKVTSAETKIRQLVNDVSSKVSQTTFDNLKRTVDSQGTSISQNQSAIALKAEKTYVDGVKTTADSALSKANANADSIKTTKAELKVTSDAVATKVSQSDFNAVDQRLTSAETTIRTQAGLIEQRLTSTQVDAAIVGKGYQTATQVNNAITSKGYQTKADVDKNITDRGYITNSALQPYVTSTVFENKVRETTDSFSRSITETKALIPTDFSGGNLIRNGAFPTIPWSGSRVATHSFYYNSQKTLFLLETASTTNEVTSSSSYFKVKRNTDYTLSFIGFSSSRVKSSDVWFLGRKTGETQGFTSTNILISSRKFSPSFAEYITATFNSGENDEAYIRFDNNGSTDGQMAVMYFGEVMLVEGRTPRKWEACLDDFVTEVKYNEVKDTVDSHTRTIGEQGNSISQVIQTAQGLVTRISNLSSGNRNLLKGTKDMSGIFNQAYTTSDNYQGFTIARTSSGSAAYYDTFRTATTIVPTSDTYIISFYGRSSVEGTRIANHFFSPNTTLTSDTSDGYKSISTDGTAYVTLSTSWKRYWIIWTQRETTTIKTVVVGRNFSTNNATVEIAGVALYEGNLNKDWSPAPEDSDTAVQAVSTQVSTLAGSYAIKSLTKAGDVLGQINLNRDGSIKLDGSLVQITGKTYIQDGVISAAKIGDLDAGKIKTGTLDAARIKANSIDGSKLVFDQAFVNKMTANEALFKQLFAQSAFITSVQAVAVSAKQIAGGIAKALNGGMDVNFDESKINFYTNVAAIRRIYTGHPTQFIKFETEGNYSRTIIGSNRNGGEVFNSATFAGIVVENTNNINTEDNVRIYGDNTLLRHAQGDVGWNINSVTQRIVPANMNAESEIWSKHFVAPDKNSKPVRLDTAVAALWDIWNHIIYNNFEFNAALRTHIKARRDNWKFELNL
uniref:gp58-like family protein n=2 Tax=Streptococcus suis TaxID=1307 RepID=UPI001CF43B9C|nr:gp58-like family protein [Streptococcus suis]